MMRNQKKHEVCSITYKTMRRNEWNIVCQLTTRYMKTLYYVKSRDDKGAIAYNLYFLNMEGEEHLYLVKYSAHFFARYNERMELGFTDTSKIIRHFFRNNFDFDQGESEELDDGSRLLHFVFEDGIGIGWKDDDRKIICLKTFIANNTLTKNQRAIVENIKSDTGYSVLIKPRHLENRFSD
jgi:hypothetical protein